jgi:DNA-binding MarR family transcriptional regulator
LSFSDGTRVQVSGTVSFTAPASIVRVRERKAGAGLMERMLPSAPMARTRAHDNHDPAARALAHLRRIVHAIHAQSARIESALGLTGPQLWALREVARSAEGISLGEIAKRLALHKATAGRLVERLISARLVRGTRPAWDRRIFLVVATPRGARLARRSVANPAQADLLSKLERLEPSRLRRFERALAGIVKLIGAEKVKPAPLFEESRASRGTS